MKKALALILSMMMILSVCSVSAAFVDNVGATEGVILSDDFESYASIDDTRRANGGPYNSTGGAWPMTIDGNKVWATQVSDGDQTLWYNNSRTGAAAVSSGKLIISMDVMVVGGYEGTKLYNDSVYPSIYVTLWTTTNNTQFCVGNTSDEDAAKGGIVSFKNGSYGVTTSDANVAYFSADEFHTIKEVIDYKAGKTYFYLDEALVYTANGATPWITGTGEFGFLNNGGTTNANFPADANGVKPYVCVDNISLEAVKDYTDVPSSELDAPVELLNINFDGETALDESEWRIYSFKNSSVADGVVSLAPGDEIYLYMPPTNTSDIFEMSYDVYANASASHGRLVLYEYVIPGSGVSPNSANFGAYYPGNGFCLGRVLNGDCSGNLAPDVEKWYTVKIEWCGAEDNRYLNYTILDRETQEVVTTRFVRGKWVNADGTEVARYNQMQSMMIWNHAYPGSTTFKLDNFVVKKLPYGYNQKTYTTQIWVDNVRANSESVFRSGTVLEASAYAPNSTNAQLILAAYNENHELVATTVAASPIREEYKILYTIQAEDGFDGASYVRAFLLGEGTGFKPITAAYNSAVVAAE